MQHLGMLDSTAGMDGAIKAFAADRAADLQVLPGRGAAQGRVLPATLLALTRRAFLPPCPADSCATTI